jgi:Uncharacterized protein conserved in bacteria (DUF2066)
VDSASAAPRQRNWLEAITVALFLFTVLPAQAAESVYTIANYPAEAAAESAVEAKSVALADAQGAAFRYLLKRLVPVTVYKRLPKIEPERVEDMIEGMSVRNEQNSATEYLATLDINFKPAAVQKVMRAYNLPFVDRQSGPITLMPVFALDAGAATAGSIRPDDAQKAWRQAWSGLDLSHSLTPIRLAVPGPSADNDVFVKLMKGDMGKLGIIEAETSAERLVVALATVTDDGKKLRILLVGRDWAGDLWWKTATPVASDDFAFSAETLAVLSLSVLEGRWKAKTTPSTAVAAPGTAETAWAVKQDMVAFTAEFASLAQWQQMRAQLSQVQGVQSVQVGQLSTRQADVTLAYPGGLPALSNVLALQGFALVNEGGRWILHPG